ncbi:MAG TPA: urate hydroxylase PuuD [Thermoanaerobaculia bacterium]|nr:urate hydroxylase PuuD [Thermoanaerobaculia bacterium]
MNQELNNVIQLILRWAHVVAAVAWIGHLWFFNWVNGPFQGKIDGPTKRAVNPELMPRALYWFRWGAAWTWITGILLGGLIYYHGRIVFEDPNAGNPWLWLAILLVILAVGFVVYNFIMKAIPNKVVGAAICLVLFAGVYELLDWCGHFSGRALYIHAGLIFGTMMALNVWMIIWPNQQKIIAATKAGTPLAPDSPEVKIAGLRSRHNTYMSVPLIFTMISNHYPTMYGGEYRDLCLAAVIALGFFITWLLYKKAAKVPGM